MQEYEDGMALGAVLLLAGCLAAQGAEKKADKGKEKKAGKEKAGKEELRSCRRRRGPRGRARSSG